ncbi:hypothetical protein K370107A2_06720 [Merdimmobilis hominis]
MVKITISKDMATARPNDIFLFMAHSYHRRDGAPRRVWDEKLTPPRHSGGIAAHHFK